MVTLNRVDLALLQNIIEQDIPGFGIRFKNCSLVMKLLGFLVYPFNPRFMTDYVTTWGRNVYFPSERHFLESPVESFRILAHEFVHLWDAKQHWYFKSTYMFPQILAIVPLVIYAVLAWPYTWLILLPFLSYILGCGVARLSRVLFWVVLLFGLGGTAILAGILTGFLSLILLGFMISLIPWPAPGRVKWELRGYGMNVALAYRLYGISTKEHLVPVIKQFIGPAYFFMCWSGGGVQRELERIQASAMTGALREDYPYGRVFELLDEH